MEAENYELDAISACRISACGGEWLKGRGGRISACVLDYPWKHLLNKTPFYFCIIYGEGMGRSVLVVSVRVLLVLVWVTIVLCASRSILLFMFGIS